MTKLNAKDIQASNFSNVTEPDKYLSKLLNQ
jgi:hypothetical protein